jgi:hypothetical protein
MTQSQAAGFATRPHALIGERENQRAVELIESAERSSPYCLCGSHMLAVARGEEVWLECAGQATEKTGLAGLVARLTAFSHTRRMIMELPAAN